MVGNVARPLGQLFRYSAQTNFLNEAFMSESKPEIGVLNSLPSTIRFLAEPAQLFGSIAESDLTEEERSELTQIAKRVREGNFFPLVEEFLEQYSMVEFEECANLLNFFRLLHRLGMTYKNYLMSFVTDESGQMVSVHLDLNGANRLIEALEGIRDGLIEDDCPHAHLFANEQFLQDDDLTSTMLSNQPQEQKTVGHVKIYGWNDEWAKKHQLRPY